MREDHLGAVQVGFDRPHGALDDQLHADGRGEMEDDVSLIDELRHDVPAGARLERVVEAGARLEMADVLDRAGR